MSTVIYVAPGMHGGRIEDLPGGGTIDTAQDSGKSAMLWVRDAHARNDVDVKLDADAARALRDTYARIYAGLRQGDQIGKAIAALCDHDYAVKRAGGGR